MVHEKRSGWKSVSYDEVGFRSNTIRLAVGEVIDIVLRVFELLLLSYGLCGNNFCKTLQAWRLKPCKTVSHWKGGCCRWEISYKMEYMFPKR